MADWIKMGIKAGIILTATGIIVAIFANIQIPALDYTQLRNSVGMGKAFIEYWLPTAMPFILFFISLLLVKIAIMGAKIALIAIRWVLKVNE